MHSGRLPRQIITADVHQQFIRKRRISGPVNHEGIRQVLVHQSHELLAGIGDNNVEASPVAVKLEGGLFLASVFYN